MFIKVKDVTIFTTGKPKKQTNAIGAIHNNRLFAVGLYECSINSQVFCSWVETVLLPELPPNSVIWAMCQKGDNWLPPVKGLAWEKVKW